MTGQPAAIDYGPSGEARLKAFVEQAMGGNIVRWEQQVRWRPAWFVDVNRGGETVRLHLRGDRQSDIVPFPELRREADIIDVLHANGVPVPAVYGFCEDPPAILMEALPGTRDMSGFNAEQRETITRQYIRAVAAMHKVPLASFGARGLSIPGPEKSALAGLDAYLPLYARVKRKPEPFIEFALGWIHRNAPRRTEPAFTQYDSGQFLAEGERMTGMYDFEFGMIGDPMMDLATMRMRDSYEPLGAEFRVLCDLYGEAAGAPVNHDAIAFHTVQFATLSTMMISGAVADPQPGAPHAVYLEWDLALRRVMIQALAECMGMAVSAEPAPAIATTGDAPVIVMLRDAFEQVEVDDPMQVSRRRSALQLVEYLERVRSAEPQLTAQALEEVSDLLGRSFTDWRDAETELERFVQHADSSHDARLFDLFARQHERRVSLLADTAIGRSARNVHLPPSR
jgi:aminoglycoside phosphotransferase (APT) family kinase protein